jgi:hypothetical protein
LSDARQSAQRLPLFPRDTRATQGDKKRFISSFTPLILRIRDSLALLILHLSALQLLLSGSIVHKAGY